MCGCLITLKKSSLFLYCQNYVEGCTAPTYSADSLHSAVVEIYIRKGGRCRYSTIQNWSNNILNLVTKRAVCEDYAHMGLNKYSFS